MQYRQTYFYPQVTVIIRVQETRNNSRTRNICTWQLQSKMITYTYLRSYLVTHGLSPHIDIHRNRYRHICDIREEQHRHIYDVQGKQYTFPIKGLQMYTISSHLVQDSFSSLDISGKRYRHMYERNVCICILSIHTSAKIAFHRLKSEANDTDTFPIETLTYVQSV